MKIVHINTTRGGGAGIAARRLHEGMRACGLDSVILFKDELITQSTVTQKIANFTGRVLRKIKREFFFSSRARKQFGVFSDASRGTDLTQYLAVQLADVIYLHWVNDFLSLDSIEKIFALGKPVYWFMHDMWPITGGCHHSFTCNHYESDCRNCMFVRAPLKNKIAHRQFTQKQKLFAKYQNIFFIAPSKWLYTCAQRSALTQNKKIFNLPNLLDTDKFQSYVRHAALNAFKIEEFADRKLIAFGANAARTNPYKGWPYLLEALKKVAERHRHEIALLVFGNDETGLSIRFAVPIYSLGQINEEVKMSMAYSCADVFVTPSLADNFPNTIVESFACGVPVVGFNVGGIPDLVNGDTGYLAEYKSVDDLARGIEEVLFSGKKYAQQCRNAALQYSVKEIVARHQALWESNAHRS